MMSRSSIPRWSTTWIASGRHGPTVSASFRGKVSSTCIWSAANRRGKRSADAVVGNGNGNDRKRRQFDVYKRLRCPGFDHDRSIEGGVHHAGKGSVDDHDDGGFVCAVHPGAR